MSKVDERVEHARIQKAALKTLMESEGWRILCEVMQENVKARTDRVMLLPTGAEFSPSEQEFMKGEVTAYRTLMALPSSLVEMDSAIIDRLPEEV